MLIDSSSTHNLINEDIATSVGAFFSDSCHLCVTVANDDHVTYRGMLRHAPLTIGRESLVVDHAIPLGGFDVVLDTRFLKTFGSILWEFSAL